MKFRIAIIAIILVVLAAYTWATECCQIEVGSPQTNGSKVVVPPDTNGPGGTYISTATQTIAISCINTSNSKPCGTQAIPNNVVTATGAGANSGGNFIACDPSFAGNPTQTTFENVGTSYTISGASCVESGTHPFWISVCPSVSCPCNAPCKPTRSGCECNPPSPIILDLDGKGFELTSAAGGVLFDMSGTGAPEQMGWIAKGANNAFLALPGGDGLVHNGRQLFGNFTPQPASVTPNGFAALAVYDDPKNGGNGDGVIDSRDAIFSSLRLWIDANHDGICQKDELYTLPSLGVNSLSLKYKEADRTDQYGNAFRYGAPVNPDDPDASRVDRKAFDVFFVTLGSPTTKNILPSLSPAGQKCAVPVPGKGGMLSSSK